MEVGLVVYIVVLNQRLASGSLDLLNVDKFVFIITQTRIILD